MVTEDLVNLKKDGVSAEEAIDVKKGRKKKKEKRKKRYTEAIDFRGQYHLSETTTVEAENE